MGRQAGWYRGARQGVVPVPAAPPATHEEHDHMSERYPAVPAHPSFPALEREVLDRWAVDLDRQAGWYRGSRGTPATAYRSARPRRHRQ